MNSVLVENNGDMKFYARTKDSEFVMGVDGGGASPVDTVLAGLCGCVGHYVRDFFAGRNTPCPGFTIKAEAGSTSDNARMSDIDVFLDLKGIKLSKDEEGALAKHIEKCKVHNTLKAACGIRMVLV